MPLDGHHVVTGPLERFDRAVGAPCGDDPPVRHAVDGLVVQRVHDEAVSVEIVQQGARLERQLVDAVRRRLVPAGVMRHVLVQRSATPHVEQLQAAADPEHRHLGGHGHVDEPELDAIALWIRRLVVRFGASPVQRWIEVLATRQQQPVDAPDVVSRIDVERQVDRESTRLDDRPGVLGDVQVEVHVGQAAGESLQVTARSAPAGQADQGSSLTHLGPNYWPPVSARLGLCFDGAVRSSPHRYRDRDEAGRILADLVVERLAAEGGVPGASPPLVLGLPRGGVPVAAVIADRIDGELDVLCVRKIGTPGQRELALGAVASGGLTVLNDDLIYQLGLTEKAVRRSIEAGEEELAEQEARFRPDRPPLSLGARVVIVVDDGLATGATMRAAVRAVRTAEPSRLIGAVPVGAPESCQVLETLTDEFICPLRPPLFSAVGQWYRDFSATSDADVHRLLAAHQRPD